MEDCVTQMTAMSKSKMHMELVSKAKLRSRNNPVSKTENQNQSVFDEAKMIHDILESILDVIVPRPKDPASSCPAPSPPHPASCPPPPPPPPPPVMRDSDAKLTPNLDDSITHMTTMSKSRMHAELIAKSQSRMSTVEETKTRADEDVSEVSNPTIKIPDRQKKTLERKKVVGDILEKSEPTSATKKINDERRRLFFEDSGGAATLNDSDNQEITTPQKSHQCDKECPESENEVKVERPPGNEVKVERPPRRKDLSNSVSTDKSNKEKENNAEESAANSKKSCIIS